MADQKISELAEKTTPVGADLAAIVDTEAAPDETKKITLANLLDLAVILSVALPENTSILLDAALSADGKWSGISETGTAGAALAFGEVVYLAVADSKWEKAIATAAATACGKIGIVVVAGAENAAVTILLYGKIRADSLFPTFTVAAPVYLSKDTAGVVTNTIPPKATNHVVRILGYGNTGNELFWCPGSTYLEYA